MFSEINSALILSHATLDKGVVIKYLSWGGVEIEVIADASISEPYLYEPLVPKDDGIRGQNQAVADENKDVDGITRIRKLIREG